MKRTKILESRLGISQEMSCKEFYCPIQSLSIFVLKFTKRINSFSLNAYGSKYSQTNHLFFKKSIFHIFICLWALIFVTGKTILTALSLVDSRWYKEKLRYPHSLDELQCKCYVRPWLHSSRASPFVPKRALPR